MITVQVDSRAALQKLTNVQNNLDNLEQIITHAVVSMQAFIDSNIEIDTGRTRGSVSAQVRGGGSSVEGVIGAHTHYAPWVRDAGHTQQFLHYASDNHGPVLQRQMGQAVQVAIRGS